MKTIYTAMNEPRKDGAGDVYEENPTFDKSEALRHAVYAWNHLTSREQQQRRVYVAVYAVDVPEDDPRPAAQIYQEMMLDDTWPHDWDVINLPAE